MEIGQFVENTVAFNAMMHGHFRVTLHNLHRLIVTSWISLWEHCEWVRLKYIFCDQTVSTEIVGRAETFCKPTNHVGAQVISHYAGNSACTGLALKRYALGLQLTQVRQAH